MAVLTTVGLIGADFPRFLVVEVQHANPYYDDSYAVNSASMGAKPAKARHRTCRAATDRCHSIAVHFLVTCVTGPWGDAIMHELLPTIESRFRGIGEGWARFTYGGSTGGWEALAVQVCPNLHFDSCCCRPHE